MTQKPKKQQFPMYSWRKGIIHYRIQRNYIEGNVEIVARVPININGSEEIACEIAKSLNKNNQNIPS